MRLDSPGGRVLAAALAAVLAGCGSGVVETAEPDGGADESEADAGDASVQSPSPDAAEEPPRADAGAPDAAGEPPQQDAGAFDAAGGPPQQDAGAPDAALEPPTPDAGAPDASAEPPRPDGGAPDAGPAPNRASLLSECPAAAFVTHTSPVAETSAPLPAYLETVTPQDFGTSITRVSGTPGDPVPTTWAIDTSINGRVWRVGDYWAKGGPGYTNETAWNADQSLLICKTCVDGGHLFMDGSTYRPLFFRGYPNIGGYGETRWHPTDPAKMVYVGSRGEAGWYFPSTGSLTPKYLPAGDPALAGTNYSDCTMGQGNGTPSLDGRVVAVACANTSGTGATVVWLVDVDRGVRISPLFRSEVLDDRAGWPAGLAIDGWMVAKSGLRGKAAPDYRMHVTLDAATGAELQSWQYMGHEDACQDASGNDVIYSGGEARMIDMVTGAQTSFSMPGAAQYHTSCSTYGANGLRGWGFVAREDKNDALPGEIFAQELKPGGRLLRLGHHRTRLDTAANGHECEYVRCAYPVPSNDGKRIHFNSDWGDASGPIYGFVLDVRSICPD